MTANVSLESASIIVCRDRRVRSGDSDSLDDSESSYASSSLSFSLKQSLSRSEALSH